jgi:hypothetical protein
MSPEVGLSDPPQISREFRGTLPTAGAIAFVARIVREGLESAEFPEYERLIALSDEYLVQEATLVKAVPDDVWIRNGFDPLGPWEPASGRSGR